MPLEGVERRSASTAVLMAPLIRYLRNQIGAPAADLYQRSSDRPKERLDAALGRELHKLFRFVIDREELCRGCDSTCPSYLKR